mgnify:CR=1 FL=1
MYDNLTSMLLVAAVAAAVAEAAAAVLEDCWPHSRYTSVLDTLCLSRHTASSVQLVHIITNILITIVKVGLDITGGATSNYKISSITSTVCKQ